MRKVTYPQNLESNVQTFSEFFKKTYVTGLIISVTIGDEKSFSVPRPQIKSYVQESFSKMLHI